MRFPTNDRAGPGGRLGVRACVLLLCVLSAARAAWPYRDHLFAPGTTWALDHAFSADVIEVGRRIHATTGRVWGYEPHFMAGYPFAFLEHNLVSHQYAALAIPGVTSGQWVRFGVVLGCAAIPWLLYASFRGFGIERRASLAITLIGVVLLDGSELEMFRATGPVVGGFVSVLVLPVLASAHAFLTRDRVGWGLAFVALTALDLLVHKGAVLLLPVPVLAIAAARANGRVPRTLGILGAALVATLAVNGAWLAPMLRYVHWRSAVPWPLWTQHDPLRIVTEVVTPAAGFDGFVARDWLGTPLWGSWLARLSVEVLGLCGLLRLADRPLRRALVAALVWLAMLAFYGSWIDAIAAFEPFRYVIAYRVLWLLPAGFAVERWLARPVTPALGSLRLDAVALAGWVVAVSALPTFTEFVRRQTMSAAPPAGFTILDQWVRERAPREGRLMVEDAWVDRDDPGPYQGSYVLGMLALDTARELIGGRAPYIRVAQRFASFTGGEAFGARLDDLAPARLARYLDLYDVTGIAAWHPASRAALDALAPLVTVADDQGPFRFYRVNRTPSAFERGSGRVSATWGEIDVSEVQPAEGEVVLRYHWAEGLTATPSARVEPVVLEDDPAPFVRVIAPPSSFRLRLGG